MTHYTAPQFWEHYHKLPDSIQKLADKKFDLLKENPKHPSLHLKKVKQFWSVRVGLKYRSLAVEIVEGFIWFWIGTHSEYDQLISS